MSSAEKKRSRDRKAQQNIRDKRLRHLTKLEEQVSHCEQHHSDQGVQQLLEVISGLRSQNQILLSRQDKLRRIVGSWDVDPTPNHPLCSAEGQSSPEPRGDHEPALPTSVSVNHPGTVDNSDSHPTGLPTSSTSPLSSNSSPWNLLPLNDDDFSNPQTVTCPWLAFPEKIVPCPDSPSSPLDLLYGTNTNFLADIIHTTMRRRPFRDPERLALGWMAYHLTKWLVSPSPATYANIPPFVRPVLAQIEIPHPVCLDFLMWPAMRLNMIHRWHMYRDHREDLFAMFACCIKIRWPWGERILERNAENELVMRPSFYERFMSESGWGLTPEFIARYADLLEGVDLRSIIYEIVGDRED